MKPTGPLMRKIEAWRLKIEPWRVAGSHQFDEEQDPDPHQSGESDPDPMRMKMKRGIRIQTRIRIHMKVMQIRNINESLFLINRLTWSSYFLAKVPEAANSWRKLTSIFALSKKEFIHFVKVFFWMWRRSSWRARIRPWKKSKLFHRTEQGLKKNSFKNKNKGNKERRLRRKGDDK